MRGRLPRRGVGERMMEGVEAARRIGRDLERLAGLGVAHGDENLAVGRAPQQRDVDAIAAAVVELSERGRGDVRLIAGGEERILGDRLQVTRDFGPRTWKFAETGLSVPKR